MTNRVRSQLLAICKICYLLCRAIKRRVAHREIDPETKVRQDVTERPPMQGNERAAGKRRQKRTIRRRRKECYLVTQVIGVDVLSGIPDGKLVNL